MATEKTKNREMTRAQKRIVARSKRGGQKCRRAASWLTTGNATVTLSIGDGKNPFRRTTVRFDNLDGETYRAILGLLRLKKAQYTTDITKATYKYLTGESMNPEMIRECQAASIRLQNRLGD